MLRNCLPLLLLAAPLSSHAAERIEFNRDVRPILADACFHCHGPDKAKRKADLRLDTAAGKSVVVAGKPAESELIRRIHLTAKDEVMPPPSSGRTVTAQQKEVLKKWIEQGAEWQTHWAYLVPKRPELPSVKDAAWAKNPIDRFVLARLEKEGLRPSPAVASKR